MAKRAQQNLSEAVRSRGQRDRKAWGGPRRPVAAETGRQSSPRPQGGG
jgi:hypothetical protein